MTRAAVLTERDIQQALYWRHRSSARIMVPNYTLYPWGECDMLVVTHAGYTIEYEIKISVADYRRDFRKKPWKHDRLRDPASIRWRPTRFFFVVPDGLIPLDDVPAYAGLVYASTSLLRITDLKIIRPAPRLSNMKVKDAGVAKMRDALIHRFWSERFRFDAYRKDVKQKCVAGEWN